MIMRCFQCGDVHDFGSINDRCLKITQPAPPMFVSEWKPIAKELDFVETDNGFAGA